MLTMKIFKNAIGYVRVSTEQQANDDKFGIDIQKQAILLYANNNGYNIVDWKIDEVSGAKDDRPALNEILYGDNVTNPPYESIIVAKSDRVARDIEIYYYYKMLLRKKGVTLISVSEDFGKFGGFSDMLESFTLCVAKMERENINKRTSAGRKQKAKMGGYAGGRIPMGYALENGKLIINEPEAKVVRYIFSLRRNGATFYEIIDALKRAGHKSRNGKDFAISTVQSILNNEKTYRGFYKYGKNADWVQGVHEPILTKEGDGENQS